jgi:ribose/xylose/arabinose/galactoside ABC-type transport system permease subunit
MYKNLLVVQMKKLELYSYLVLIGYIIVMVIVAGLRAQYFGVAPKIAAQQAADLTALPLLAWIVLTVYYLARWVMNKSRTGRKA